jgi:Zn ribbon nucleic-acid-binding protein
MIIPILITWTTYRSTLKGSVPKVVACENCSTEYVYVIERQASGVGDSVYMLNNAGAADHARSTAEDTLKTVLENDFDPVPCPVCGHYQRYMFPKMLGNRWTWIQALMLVVILIGCLAAVFALYWSVAYLLRQTDYRLGNMIASWSVLVLLSVMGLGLSLLKNVKIRRFNPNREDQQARIAIGRSRAITRAAFEKAQEETRRLASWREATSSDDIEDN